MAFSYNDFIFNIKCFQHSHGGLFPQKIIMNPKAYADLKTEVEEQGEIWNNNNLIEIDDAESSYRLLGVMELKHHTCPLCGWTDRKESFMHQIDYVDICDHCFENIYNHKNVDVEWIKQVNEHNDIVRNEMDENYLETYGEILFGEKE